MAKPREQADLFSDRSTPDGTLGVNPRCLVRTRDGHRVVVVAGIVLAQYAVGDRMAEAHAMVSLVEQGWAQQTEVARAFGCVARTLRRHQRRLDAGGLAGLGREGGYPKGRPRMAASRARLIRRLKEEGQSNREIARRLGVCEKAVRKMLRRLGWCEIRPEQTPLPMGDSGADPKLSAPARSAALPLGTTDTERSAEAPPVEADLPVSFDSDPADRRVDRVLA